jgi:3-methyladenine DNA glycosylase/8-oxoguanine DNA glycosylase
MGEIQIPTPTDFSFDRTVRSHGWFDLPPFVYDQEAATLRFAFQGAGGVVTVVVADGKAAPNQLLASVSARGATARREAAAVVRSVLRLDEDLGPLRAALAGAPELLRCVDAGGGRLMRAPSVFEDVTKMLCTINCSWSLTRVMVGRLVEAAGTEGAGGVRAFPTAAALAARPKAFFRNVVRAGYRAPYLKDLATRVVRGELELEALRDPALPTEVAYDRLRSITGVGPYAADNLLRLLGHNDNLGLDSWCRARYVKLYPRTRKDGVDAAITRRYRGFSPYQGLAMWLDLTRSWHEPEAAAWP